MKHISMTPFGRHPVAASHMARHALADAPCPALPVDKWAVLRDLTTARKAFAVSDRDLTVLQALLSFLPATEIGPETQSIVFPSNASLGERAHGMPESTLRRHLGALVSAGLILRHDSPNGKRYARTDRGGQITRAFGFDLRPLSIRANEIACAADQAQDEAAALRDLREEVILKLRDMSQLALEPCAALHRELRRKLTLPQMRELASRIEHLHRSIPRPKTAYPSGNDSQNERHIQNSNKPIFESESTPIALAEVLDVCTEAKNYSFDPIQTWHELRTLAASVSPMMGITQETFNFAVRRLGPDIATIVVLCILQRFEKIKRPGAYLRAIALQDSFQPKPMLDALARRKLTAVNWAMSPGRTHQ